MSPLPREIAFHASLKSCSSSWFVEPMAVNLRESLAHLVGLIMRRALKNSLKLLAIRLLMYMPLMNAPIT
jgi:hypothetical protein